MTIMSQQTGTAAGPAERLAKWAPLAVILCGTFVYILDFFVVTVARDLECAGQDLALDRERHLLGEPCRCDQ
jgi:hypothetical protein